MRIAEVAERSGFSPATLRYYEQVVAGLGLHTPDGPCDADCGCVGDVACTLEATALPGRIQEWRDLAVHVVARTRLDDGLRLQLHSATPLDQLAPLMRAEQECCAFFAFALTVDSRGLALEVRAPAKGMALVDALFAVTGSG